MSIRKGVDDELEVLTVCGVGMGTSLILRMTAARASFGGLPRWMRRL